MFVLYARLLFSTFPRLDQGYWMYLVSEHSLTISLKLCYECAAGFF